MKQSLLHLFFLALALSSHFAAVAQKVETIEKKCKGLEYDKRIRIAVGSFKTTTNPAYGQFAGELQTMLSNALVMTDCYQVLAGTNSNIMSDMQDEKEFQRSDDVDQDAALLDGKMLGAQIIITGEITEFAEGKQGFTVAGVSTSKNTAKVGFILQIANPQTRQILFSESVNTDAISLGGFSGVRFFGLPAIGSFKTKAMADAVEKAIIKSVEFIVEKKDQMPAMPGSNAGGDVVSVIKINNIDYAGLGELTNSVKSNPKVKDAVKKLSEGAGTIKVTHAGTLEDLADYLLSSAKGYEIVTVEKGQVVLRKK
ncbi:MAG: CsgG/HfaB family protein [Saprospiraceae bacterium]